MLEDCLDSDLMILQSHAIWWNWLKNNLLTLMDGYCEERAELETGPWTTIIWVDSQNYMKRVLKTRYRYYSCIRLRMKWWRRSNITFKLFSPRAVNISKICMSQNFTRLCFSALHNHRVGRCDSADTQYMPIQIEVYTTPPYIFFHIKDM